MPARTFAIGDVHGCAVALRTVCESLDLTQEDRLVILGDVVDRGPDTSGAIEYLLKLREQCEVIMLLGNHEEMLLEAFVSRGMFRNWLEVGGKEALDSYQKDMRNIPKSHRDFLGNAKPYYETETEIYVHANLEPGVALEKQPSSWLRWQHLTGFEYPHESGRRVICGHTQQKSGRPLLSDGWVCLDTSAYRGHPLTCLHVETDVCHRATDEGNLLPPAKLAAIAT